MPVKPIPVGEEAPGQGFGSPATPGGSGSGILIYVRERA